VNTNLIPVITTLAQWMRDTLPPIIKTLADFYTQTLYPALKTVIDFIRDPLLPIYNAMMDVIIAIGEQAIKPLVGIWNNLLKPAFDAMGSVINTTLKPAFDAFVGWLNNVTSGIGGLKGIIDGALGWLRDLDLSTCLLLDDETPHILADVRRLMDEQGFLPWDAKKQTGDLRYCVIRLGRNTGERLITLLVKDLTRFTPEIREAITATLAPRCTSLYLGENPEITDLSLAKTLVSLHGPAYLTEEVNGLRYRIHPNSFFQTNTKMAAALQQTVLDLALAKHAPNTKFLDLYCGLGFFGIAAAARGATVYGHELDAPAIELAKQNAELNGVGERTRFDAGPVEKLDWASETPDVVLVDPPRAGLHPRAVETLLKNAPPTIVYVSCNYHRLVEELKTLKTGYRVIALQALDLFPQTPHVEVVAKLEKIT
jgi:16S rRNA G966 N2-methylase RsmD